MSWNSVNMWRFWIEHCLRGMLTVTSIFWLLRIWRIWSQGRQGEWSLKKLPTQAIWPKDTSSWLIWPIRPNSITLSRWPPTKLILQFKILSKFIPTWGWNSKLPGLLPSMIRESQNLSQSTIMTRGPKTIPQWTPINSNKLISTNLKIRSSKLSSPDWRNKRKRKRRILRLKQQSNEQNCWRKTLRLLTWT